NVLRPDLRHADEIAGRVRVRDGAPVVGRSLRELLLPSETGMWILAIRRGDDWQFGPDADTVLSQGDVLLYQGPEEGVTLIRELAGAPPLPEPPEPGAPPRTDRNRAGAIRGGRRTPAEWAVGLRTRGRLSKDPALAAKVPSL